MTENQPPAETPFVVPSNVTGTPLQQEVDRLVEANKAGFAELAAMGAQVDPAGLLNLRIDVLAEMVLGSGPGITQFRLRFERKVAEVLEELRGQVRKAQLGAAAQQFSPQQIRQIAKAQGLLDGNGNPVRR